MDLMDYRRKIIANSPHLMSASGAVATFSDGADLPLKSLIVDINPVQDLHGQDAPYPAGGGKNLLPYPFAFSGQTTVSGVTFSDNGDGTITATGTATATAQIDLYTAVYASNIQLESGATYTLSGAPSDGMVGVVIKKSQGEFVAEYWARYGAHTTFTVPSDDADYRARVITRVMSGTTVSNTVFKPQLEKGSTATAYAPYENICPISGWNGVKVTRRGKNLWNPHVYTGIAYNPTVGNTVTLTDSATQFTDNGNGVFTVTTSSTWRYFNVIIPIDPTKGYATKFVFNSTGQAGVTRGYLDADYKILTKFNSTDSAISWEYSLIPEANAAYYYFVFANRGTASATLTLTQPQFVEDTTVGDYEPYNGVDVSIDLGQTVYGAKLYPLEGKALITMVMVDLGTLNWNKSGDSQSGGFIGVSTSIATGASAKKEGRANIISDSYAPNLAEVGIPYIPNLSISGQSNNNNIYVRNDSATSSAEIKTMLSGVYACYELATPYTVQLTPHQIRSLYGNNTIFADTGNVALEYWAHP